MADVICDTSFLLHIATKRIKNIDNLDTEIGQIHFVVPEIVKNELEKLSQRNSKKTDAQITLEFIKNLQSIQIIGDYADKAILDHVRKNRGIVATLDKELKNKVKDLGGSIISLSNDKIVLEP